MAALPGHAPVPRLLWSYDEGVGGWVTLVFEDVDGRAPAQPWNPEELDRVLDALVALSTALTPSPLPVRSASHAFATSICGWQRLRQEPADQLDPGSIRHLDALADLEARAPTAVAGDTLLHLEIRAETQIRPGANRQNSVDSTPIGRTLCHHEGLGYRKLRASW